MTRLEGRRIALMIESDGAGGAERMIASLACTLRAQGNYVVVIVLAKGNGWLASQVRGTDVAVETLELRRPASPWAARRLLAILRAHRVQLVHSHDLTMSVHGAVAARWLGLPHIMTMHGGTFYRHNARRRPAMRLAAALSDAVIGVGRTTSDLLEADLRLPAASVLTIPNGINPPRIGTSTLRAELGLGRNDRLLLAVGNLYAVKGHDDLVRALRLIGDEYPTAHVAIAGRGEQAHALTLLARRLALGDRVHLLGVRSDVGNLLASADLFVHPSISEGLPLAVLEAMSAGRPVIATDVGDVSTVLARGEAGRLVPSGDAPALAQAIRELLSDPVAADRLSRAATARVQAEYTLERMVQRYSSVYLSALEGARRSAATSAPVGRKSFIAASR